MSELAFVRDGWPGEVEGDAEAQTLTRLRVEVRGEVLTRNVSKRGGGESEAISTSLLPLAEFVAQNWWTLLYEPVRPAISDAFRARHRLDSGMRGYAFPALALWSGGDGSVVSDWAAFSSTHTAISFLNGRPEEPLQLDRAEVELSLMELIETVIERAGRVSHKLIDDWVRVRTSIASTDELNYCIAAGRLGFDPYDPQSFDLTDVTAGLSDSLFSDASEILEVPDLVAASKWLRQADARLKIFPEIDLSQLGEPVGDDLAEHAGVAGQVSAELLRARTGLPVENPRKAVSDLLGGAISEAGQINTAGPIGISAIVQRLGSTARIGTVARSAKQRRFRACAATYMAWTASEGQERAATDAFTRRQQASRGFAAEMLAPIQTLVGRAPRHGFDDEDLLDLAHEFICPYETIKWQSIRAGIPLRGIAIPPLQRDRVITSIVRA